MRPVVALKWILRPVRKLGKSWIWIGPVTSTKNESKSLPKVWLENRLDALVPHWIELPLVATLMRGVASSKTVILPEGLNPELTTAEVCEAPGATCKSSAVRGPEKPEVPSE